MVETAKVEGLQRALSHLHSQLQHKYDRIFAETGRIQEQVQDLRHGLPRMYQEIQALIVHCEDMCREVARDNANSEINVEELNAIIGELEAQATNAQDQLTAVRDSIDNLTNLVPSR